MCGLNPEPYKKEYSELDPISQVLKFLEIQNDLKNKKPIDDGMTIPSYTNVDLYTDLLYILLDVIATNKLLKEENKLLVYESIENERMKEFFLERMK